MKSKNVWPQVVILAILLSAILIAYAFVAPAAGAITGIATTLIGSLFLDLRSSEAKAKDAAE